MTTRRHAAIAADERRASVRVVFSLLLLGIAALELFHDLVGRATGDGPPLGESAVYIHVPLWLLAAAAVWVRRDAAWLGVLPAVASCAVHGLVATRRGSAWGPMFLAVAPVLLILAWQGRRRTHRLGLLAGAGPRLLRVLQVVSRGGGGAPR